MLIPPLEPLFVIGNHLSDVSIRNQNTTARLYRWKTESFLVTQRGGNRVIKPFLIEYLKCCFPRVCCFLFIVPCR